jgi:hypothetical protein
VWAFVCHIDHWLTTRLEALLERVMLDYPSLKYTLWRSIAFSLCKHHSAFWHCSRRRAKPSNWSSLEIWFVSWTGHRRM